MLCFLMHPVLIKTFLIGTSVRLLTWDMFGRSTGTPPMAFNNKGQPLNSWSVYNVINFSGFAFGTLLLM